MSSCHTKESESFDKFNERELSTQYTTHLNGWSFRSWLRVFVTVACERCARGFDGSGGIPYPVVIERQNRIGSGCTMTEVGLTLEFSTG